MMRRLVKSMFHCKVLCSDPKGVDLMHSYPNILDDPGFEDLIDNEMWKREDVMKGVKGWHFAYDNEASKSSWEEVEQWHISHPTADSHVIGEMFLEEEINTTPNLSWSQM